MFMILPKRRKRFKWFSPGLLTKPDEWLNKKLVVVFICAKTMRAATYDGSIDGLSFKVPKDLRIVSKAINFWKTFGPVSLKWTFSLLGIYTMPFHHASEHCAA